VSPDRLPVVAVVEATGRQARLTAVLSSVFAAAGLQLNPRSQRELVAEVTVDQSSALGPVVEPDRPLLWLIPADPGRPGSQHDRFLAAETYAAARSIALLSRSPVLNRPTERSPCGALPGGAALAVRSARSTLDGSATVRAERFTDTAPSDAGRPEVFDYGTGRSSFGGEPGSVGPYRHRPSVAGARTERVRVIGDRTVAPPPVSPGVRASSRGVAARFGLDLATVWWLTGPDDGQRTLARIDGWHWDTSFSDDMERVCAALARWILDRLSACAGTCG
jgi:hypothetical protein